MLAILIILLFVILAAALLLVGNRLVSYGLTIQGGGTDRKVSLEVEKDASAPDDAGIRLAANEAAQKERNRAFLAAHPEIEVHTESEDGLRLTGFMQEQPGGTGATHNWALLVHGYGGSHVWMQDHAERYYAHGYHTLLPDLRGCGKSEGRYMGMGWLDRRDLLCWIRWIAKRDPEASIVLHGVSMGAAAVMMTAGENTPEQVKAFVEDCGYTGAWDIFASELKLRFHLPPFPVLYAADLMARIRAGYGFREASALRQTAKCSKPMLFIHGSEDRFVPFRMQDAVYRAKPGSNKRKVVADGADHAVAHYAMGDRYWDEVFGFLREYQEDSGR